MTTQQILGELETLGNPGTKKILMRHGAKEPFFGVKVQDLKKVLKKTKKNHELSLSLYATGNSDAMYLAGLMADEKKISKEQLQEWAEQAYWYMLSEYTVPWVAAESPYGWELAMEWIDAPEQRLASAGWATLSSLLVITPDADLDHTALRKLLARAERGIAKADNRVRYTMNGFVIALGTCVIGFQEEAVAAAKRIGKVNVEMGGTACKVPAAADYIQKAADKGRLGKKKKKARC